MSRTLLVLVCLLCCSCSQSTTHTKQIEGVRAYCGSEDMRYAVVAIKKDVARRFPNAFVYVCHGTWHKGQWMLFHDWKYENGMTVQEKADRLRKLFPDRPIVFWACNPWKAKIKGKNIWYFQKTVQQIPDSQTPFNYVDSRGVPYVVMPVAGPEYENWAKGIFEAIEGE